MSTPEEQVRELRRRLQETSGVLQDLVENPEIMDDWTPAQLAWMKEHLEHLMSESRKLQSDLKRLTDA